MKKALSLLLLFVVSLSLSLLGVRLTVPLSKQHHLVVPPEAMVLSGRSEVLDDVPRATPTLKQRCNRGEWRPCLDLAEATPAKRGALRSRAEALLERRCHGASYPAEVAESTSEVQACGELAALQMARSPRLHLGARECLEHAVRDCDAETRTGTCDLAAELPSQLLERPEWLDWCEDGDELACRIHDSQLQRRLTPLCVSPAGTKGQPHCTIEGAGHFIQEDQPTKFAEVARDFFHQHR